MPGTVDPVLTEVLQIVALVMIVALVALRVRTKRRDRRTAADPTKHRIGQPRPRDPNERQL